jgi:predicted dehydrogenase
MKVAVIGAGYWGSKLVRVLHEMPEAELLYVVDSDRGKLDALPDEYFAPGVHEPRVTTSLKKMLEDKAVQGVVVATPASTHFEVVSACIKAGLHVLVEKPLTTSSADADRLCDMAVGHAVTLMVGHTFLFNPGVLKLDEMLLRDAAEDLHFGVAYMYATRTNRGPVRSDVNVLWDLAAHDIAIFCHMLEQLPVEVSAVGRAFESGQIDFAFARLTWRGGQTAGLHVSWMDDVRKRQIGVVTNSSHYLFDDLKVDEKVSVTEMGGAVRGITTEYVEPLRAEVSHFIESASRGLKVRSDGEFGAGVVRVLEALDCSMANGGAVVEVKERER